MVPIHDESRLPIAKGGKSIAVILLCLAVAGTAVGFYLYRLSSPALSQKDSETEKELISKLWLQQHFQTIDVDDKKIGGNFGDPDDDGLNNYQEYIYGSDPKNPDSDADGVLDGTEVAYNIDPTNGIIDSATYAAAQETLSEAGISVSTGDIKQIVLDNLETDRAPYIREWNLNQLKVSEDNSTEAYETYAVKFGETVGYVELPSTQDMIENYFFYNTPSQVDDFINREKNIIDQLTGLSVPSNFTTLHLAYIRLNEGFLGLAVAAKERQVKSELEEGWLYPEIQYLAALEPVVRDLQFQAAKQLGIPL